MTVTDTLPAGLTATALERHGLDLHARATLSCTRSDALAAGASYPAITLTVNVAANAPASVTNTASVTGGGETNTANNTASDPTTIDGGSIGADLSFTKTHAGNFSQGQTGATYTMTVMNIGRSGDERGGDRDRHAAGRADGDRDERHRLDVHARRR